MAVEVQTDMATPPIAKFGTAAQKQEYLAPAIAGRKIACLGITEPGAGSDVAGIRTHAVRSDGDWIVNGSKIFITNGVRADFCTLVAKTDRDAGHHGVSLFILPMDAPGVQVSRRLEKVGMWASDTAELAFTDVRLPADALLGEEGKGFYQIMWELQGERLIAAAGSAAGASYAIERLVDVARERRVGGRPLASSDWVRYRLAEAAIKVEATQELVYLTADRFDRDLYPVKEISMAKLAAMQVAWEVADLGLEIAGEHGVWYRLPFQRAWRDARLGRIGGGTDEVMRDVVGKLLEL
jgi:alkylation response protein AidB-like acyl-CoA dehydrogenase